MFWLYSDNLQQNVANKILPTTMKSKIYRQHCICNMTLKKGPTTQFCASIYEITFTCHFQVFGNLWKAVESCCINFVTHACLLHVHVSVNHYWWDLALAEAFILCNAWLEYVFSFLSESWYHFNDSTVTETHSQWVASCRAYILFYIQRDTNSKYSSKQFWWIEGLCVFVCKWKSATVAAVKSLFWSVMGCDA